MMCVNLRSVALFFSSHELSWFCGFRNGVVEILVDENLMRLVLVDCEVFGSRVEWSGWDWFFAFLGDEVWLGYDQLL